MNTTRTINVKGLEHEQRERLIFSGVEGLEPGSATRLIVEFNPLPLVYLFKSGGEFDIGYEKEGPDEWILNIRRVASSPKARTHLKELLSELSQGHVSQETKDQARDFFQSVDAKTLGDLEQELIREGISHDRIRQSLCDIHLEVMRESLVAARIEVRAPHPVHTMMEEHRIILRILNELEDLVGQLQDKASFNELNANFFERLKEVSHHLVESENHHLREEEVLFPMLEKHEVIEPPSIMKIDHIEFRRCKRELHQLAFHYETYDFDHFKERVIDLGQFLTRELASHIFKEDNILYQIALQVLTPQEWDQVKAGCDQVGYCCFTPDDRADEKYTVELDLRQLPPPQRHQQIFSTLDNLQPGQSLHIINDHDPKPLRYQLEAEYPGKFTWRYGLTGPQDWSVVISRMGG